MEDNTSMEELQQAETSYEALKRVLEQYMSFQTPDENIAKPRPNAEYPFVYGILGRLTVPLIDVEIDNHIYIRPEYNVESFILYISYISPFDLKKHENKYPEVQWYNSRAFVTGKGKCVYEYILDKDIFERFYITDFLPMKVQYEENIQKEKIQAIINKTRGRMDLYLSNIYTTGKLMKPWLNINAGMNILIIWPDHITMGYIKRLSERSKLETVEIYTISDEDKKAFEDKHPNINWYENVYVPGKNYFRFSYNLKSGCLSQEHVNQVSLLKKLFIMTGLCHDHDYCDCYSTSQKECSDYFNNNIKYYGRLTTDFFGFKENDLVVLLGEIEQPIQKIISCVKEFTETYENDWFKYENCIIGKRVQEVN